MKKNLLVPEILTAETHIMRDDQTLTWTVGSTAERGNYTEKSCHLNMKEKDMRGSAIPQEREMRDLRWHRLHVPDTGKENGIFERGIEVTVVIEMNIMEGLATIDLRTNAPDSTAVGLSVTDTAPHLTTEEVIQKTEGLLLHHPSHLRHSHPHGSRGSQKSRISTISSNHPADHLVLKGLSS